MCYNKLKSYQGDSAMKDFFPNIDLPVGNVLAMALADAALLAKKTKSKWVGVHHLFAAMIGVAHNSYTDENEELTSLRKVFEKYDFDVEFRTRVCKQLFSKPGESSLDDINDWQKVLLKTRNICRENGCEYIGADVVCDVIMNYVNRNQYIDCIQFMTIVGMEDKYLTPEEIVIKKRELKKQREREREQFEQLKRILSKFSDSEGGYKEWDEEAFEKEYGHYLEENEEYLVFSSAEELKEQLLYAIKIGCESCLNDNNVHVHNGIVNYFENLDAENLFGEANKKPTSVFLTNISPKDSEAIQGFADGCIGGFSPVFVLDMKDDYSKNMLCGFKYGDFSVPGILSTWVKSDYNHLIYIKNLEFANSEVLKVIFELLNKGKVWDEHYCENVAFGKSVIFVDAFDCDSFSSRADDFIGEGLTKNAVFDLLKKKTRCLEKFRKCFDNENTFAFNSVGCEKTVLNLRQKMRGKLRYNYYSHSPAYNEPVFDFWSAFTFGRTSQLEEAFLTELERCLNDNEADYKQKITVCFELDFDKSQKALCDLFSWDEHKQKTFLFSSKNTYESFIEYRDDKEDIIHFSDYDSAVAWLENNSPDVIVVDLEYRLRGPEARVKSIDDIKNQSTKLLKHLKKGENQVPVYVLSHVLFLNNGESVNLYYDLLKKADKYGICGAYDWLFDRYIYKDVYKFKSLKEKIRHLENEGLYVDGKFESSFLKKDMCMKVRLTDLELKKTEK